jgi:multidrug efflux pump
VPGTSLYLSPTQDLRVGGRQSNAGYQFTLRSDNVRDLEIWGPRVPAALRTVPAIADVSRDLENHGLEVFIDYDRATAARFSISPQLIDNTLYDAFGQRPISTMYAALNQYHVVMEAAPKYWRNPEVLKQVYVRSPSGQEVPLSAFARIAPGVAALSITHQGLFPAVTLSFNLARGTALGDAVKAVNAAASRAGLPANIRTFLRAPRRHMRNPWPASLC